MTAVQWVGDAVTVLCMVVAGVATKKCLFASSARELAELEELRKAQARAERELRRR